MPLRRSAIAELKRRHIAGLVGVAVAMTGAAKTISRAHNDTGTRTNSITHSVQGSTVLWGIPVNSAPHAIYLELGFTPHWVPMRYIGLWAERHGVGQIRQTSIRSQGRAVTRKQYKTVRATPLGVYVGGPGSSLESSPGGARGTRFIGRRRITGVWRTRGGTSPWLPSGKVGNPVLQPVAQRYKREWQTPYLRAYRAAA